IKSKRRRSFLESKRLLVKAYSIPHNLEVNELIEDYMRILNSILEDLWRNIAWKRRGSSEPLS
ncbi:MAG: hypothetical protein QXO62_01025, partial [Thermoproteota archaeon]